MAIWKKLLLILLPVFLSSYSSAQILSGKELRRIGLDMFEGWDRIVYFDNMDIRNLPGQKMPSVFGDFYYQHLLNTDYKILRMVDLGRKINILHFRSKQAKDGYLLINERINEFLSDSPANEFEELKMEYIFNNTPVRTRRETMRIIRLRRKSIQNIEVKKDEMTGIVSVYINAR